MKIEISSTKLSIFETCPKQFYLKYYKKMKPPVQLQKIMHVGSLVHKALELLAEYPEFDNIESCVIKAIDDIDVVPSNDMIEESIIMIKNWYKDSKFENECLASEYEFKIILDEDIVAIGFIDRVEKIGDNTIKVIDYKTGNMLYTYDDIKDSNQLLIYAMACYEHWGIENIIICYDMVRLNKIIELEVKTKEFKQKIDYIKATYSKMMKGENTAIISDKCAYCWYKYDCTEYTEYLTKVLQIKTIEDIFDGDFEKSIEHLNELENRKKLIDKYITEVKSLILSEMMGSGKSTIEFNNCKLSLETKRNKSYDLKVVMDTLKDNEALYDVIKVKNTELERILSKIDITDKNLITDSIEFREGNPYLKITKNK